jgi:hypothetical protein
MEKFAAIVVTVLALAAMAASVVMLARYSVDGRISIPALLIITTAAAMLAGLSVMMSR